MPQIQKAQHRRFTNLLDQEVLSADDVLLVPKHGILDSRMDADIEPYIYSSPMDTVTGFDLTKEMVENNHYAVVCRFLKDEWEKTFKEYHNNDMVFFAVGSSLSELHNIENLLEEIDGEKLININIDVAHGDTSRMLELYQIYREKPWVNKLMSGSVATAQSAANVIKAGCDHVRIGIGPGSACTTRLMTGCGVPLLTSVYDIHKFLSSRPEVRESVILIADGGIRYPGDAVKYLSAGADAVMLGRGFSSCDESAGWEMTKKNWWSKPTKVKRYRGQASRSFQIDVLGKTPKCPEGATGPAIYPTTTVKNVIDEYEGGLRSALSYLGLKSSLDLNPITVSFAKNTVAAQKEATPHGT
tara:strand:+ start:1326 stop:2396 length:1071 start_codon:yes stop_codon:yes gene_type:complete